MAEAFEQRLHECSAVAGLGVNDKVGFACCYKVLLRREGSGGENLQRTASAAQRQFVGLSRWGWFV
jgi:hypothetical protein